MQAGSSQAAVPRDSPPALQTKERKPRHRSKKGKGREEDPSAEGEFPPSVPKSSSKVVQKEDPAEDESTWAWASLADTSVSNHPPVFTNDSRYFFSIAGASIKIYATATGQVVSTLSSPTSSSASSSSNVFDAHTSEITAALVNPRNEFQLLTASLDGRIKVWDFLDAALLSTIEVGQPITHMCAHESMRDHVFVATTSGQKRQNEASRKEQSNVFRVSLQPSKHTAQRLIHKPMDILKIGKMRATTGLAVSPSGLWLVATGGPKAYVCSTSSLSSGFTKFVSSETLTCLAFHPLEEYFATGDQKGQIRLWYCLNNTQVSSQTHGERRAQTTTLHWHAHAVSSIAFTPNGAYLLSGGEEAVLVIWQLHTGKREFVPRVGAPIVGLAVASHQSAEEEYLLVLADGTLAFVGAGTLRMSRSFARIKLDHNYWSSGPAPLAVHKQTSTLILPSSHPSSLLVYQPLTSTLLAELEVSPSNRVSRRDEKPIEPSRVDCAVTSGSGEWLATIDGREGSDDFERETYMKIWHWDTPTSTWNLNSRIDRPHGLHRVNSLTFAPTSGQPLLISAGSDGNVKVWRTKTVSNKKGVQEVFWVCRSTLGYRSLVPIDAVCSPDGSLLTVAHGPHAVVFELSNNLLRLALTCPEVREVSQVAFVGSSGRYVVVAGRRDIVLWDLVTSSVRWHFSSPEKVHHVIPHPKEDCFAIMYRGHRPRPTLIRIFNVTSSTPTSWHTLPFRLRRVVWYPYIASGRGFSLVGISQAWNTILLGDHVQHSEGEGLSAKGISADVSPQRRNIFQDIFGASAFEGFSMDASAPISAPQDDAIGISTTSGPLNTPAYLLPPLQTLFTPLVERLLRKRSAQLPLEMEKEQGEAEDEDVVMTDPPPPMNPGSGRQLQQSEMDAFVELFKQQTFSTGRDNLTTPRSMAHTNGKSISIAKGANGSHRHKTLSSAHTPTSTNGKGHPPEPLVERALHESSPAVIGKKRKKSMG